MPARGRNNNSSRNVRGSSARGSTVLPYVRKNPTPPPKPKPLIQSLVPQPKPQPVVNVASTFDFQSAQKQQASLMEAFNQEIQRQQQQQQQYQMQLDNLSKQYQQQSDIYSQNNQRYITERNAMMKDYNKQIGSLTSNLMNIRDTASANEEKFTELQQPSPDQENFNTALNQYRLLQFLRRR